MTFRIIHFGVLIFVVAACADLKPATLNSFGGSERTASEIALIRKVDTGLSSIDGAAVPVRPEEGRSYYRDIRVLPGRHTLELCRTWFASVLVSPSGYVEGSRFLTADFCLSSGPPYFVPATTLFAVVFSIQKKRLTAGVPFG